jgi:hypothetical protein
VCCVQTGVRCRGRCANELPADQLPGCPIDQLTYCLPPCCPARSRLVHLSPFWPVDLLTCRPADLQSCCLVALTCSPVCPAGLLACSPARLLTCSTDGTQVSTGTLDAFAVAGTTLLPRWPLCAWLPWPVLPACLPWPVLPRSCSLSPDQAHLHPQCAVAAKTASTCEGQGSGMRTTTAAAALAPQESNKGRYNNSIVTMATTWHLEHCCYTTMTQHLSHPHTWLSDLSLQL